MTFRSSAVMGLASPRGACPALCAVALISIPSFVVVWPIERARLDAAALYSLAYNSLSRRGHYSPFGWRAQYIFRVKHRDFCQKSIRQKLTGVKCDAAFFIRAPSRLPRDPEQRTSCFWPSLFIVQSRIARTWIPRGDDGPKAGEKKAPRKRGFCTAVLPGVRGR